MPHEHLHFFCGVDPAPSESQRSDDGGIVIACAQPRRLPAAGEALSDNEADWWFDYVYARRLTAKEKASARQWSALLHRLHQQFRFEKIVMDPNQGGRYIQRELIQPHQLINSVESEVTPIADLKEGPTKVVRADFILHCWERGDPAIGGSDGLWPGLPGDDNLNDVLYSETKEALDHGLIGWPLPWEDWMGDPDRKALLRQWPEERLWSLKNLTVMQHQFKSVMVATREDGSQLFTKRGARQFSAVGKKDLVSAAMYARMAFKIWLRSEDWRTALNPEDECAFSGSGGRSR